MRMRHTVAWEAEEIHDVGAPGVEGFGQEVGFAGEARR